jgi:hypothetical protein
MLTDPGCLASQHNYYLSGCCLRKASNEIRDPEGGTDKTRCGLYTPVGTKVYDTEDQLKLSAWVMVTFSKLKNLTLLTIPQPHSCTEKKKKSQRMAVCLLDR